MRRLGLVALIALPIAAAAWLWWENQSLRAEAERPRAEASPDRAPPRRARTPEEVARTLGELLPPADPDAPAPERRGAPDVDWQRWATDFFLPQPGEDLLAYRDRMLPVVRAVLAPQRERVSTWRKRFESEAHLTDEQKRWLDTVARDAGEQIKDRVMNAVLSGELDPAHLKPSKVVAFSRDLLQLGDQANERFRGALAPDQQATYDGSRFDVIDYLAFTTRWEDLLFVTE